MIYSINYSILDSWLRCGEAMKLRYIKNYYPSPSPEAHRGKAFHKIIENDNKMLLQNGNRLSLVSLKDIFKYEFLISLETKGVHLSKEDKKNKESILQANLDIGLRALELYYEYAKLIIPVQIEQSFVLDIKYPLPLKGKIDLEIPENIILDFKLGKAKNQEWADRNLQGVIYSYLYYSKYQIIPTIKYIFFLERKKDPILPLEVKHTKESFLLLFKYIESFWQDLEQDIFRPANPIDWICSEKWCSFYGECKYTSKGGVYLI